MAIESTASINNSSATSGVSNSSSAVSSKKTSTDSSFKEEMEKVTSSDDKKVKDKKVDTAKDTKVEENKTENKSDKKLEAKITKDDDNDDDIDYSQFGSMALMDARNMLNNDIEQMLSINALGSIYGMQNRENIMLNAGMTIFADENPLKISMNRSDAEFFLDLTQHKEVNVQNIVMQGQNMINNGTEFSQVKQNVQISQTLLDAINKARETNQPLRIDFDQNMSVILRIGKDGALAANFIPGDKAIEQYLRNNIEQLKSAFDEQDLPYKELTYSQNRGKNNQRKNNKQQGDER